MDRGEVGQRSSCVELGAEKALGINGFGRIGRALTRLSADRHPASVVAVNDTCDDPENLRYLLRFDTVYGRWGGNVETCPGGWKIEGSPVRVTHVARLDQVDWAQVGASVVIDSSGAKIARLVYQSVLDTGVSAVVITHLSDAADVTLVPGVNNDRYDAGRHRIISAGTCDGTALSAVLKRIDDRYGIDSGSVTILHPALSYQNVLDSTLPRLGLPGGYAGAYGLGRAAGCNVLPKETSAVFAVESVLPTISERLHGMSFRVPTQAVSVAAVWLKLRRPAQAQDVRSMFADRPSSVVGYTEDPVVSTDLIGTEYAAVVDGRLIKTTDGGSGIRLTVWYDNEWGYAAHVLRIVEMLGLGWEKRP